MEKIVTFFDICSSSKIIEDLASRGELVFWRKALKSIEKTLEDKSSSLEFSIYKFLGDGWVLIFDSDTDKKALLLFFSELCDMYSSHFKKRIENRLSTKVEPVGLTFGLDIGRIHRVLIGNVMEYIGESLNIAARLQCSIPDPRDREDNPANQLMMLNRNYHNYFKPEVHDEYTIKRVDRTLKNIRNNDTFRCLRIWLTKDRKLLH